MTEPRFLVLDNWCSTDGADWPAANASWVAYKSVLESKHTMNAWEHMPAGVRQRLSDMLLLPVAWLLRLTGHIVPDSTLWGAGCHQMGPGDHLSAHLDSDRHRWNGLERRANAILFLSPWHHTWGGQLRLYDEDRRHHTEIAPLAGRLVLFEAGIAHQVLPVTCPPGHTRRSLAVYFWGEPVGPALRPRAQFLPLPGEEHNAEKDALRRQRAGLED